MSALDENLFNERRVYSKDSISLKNTAPSPFQQFSTWYKEAAAMESFEANAMVLSSASKEGFPNSRIVLLKKYSEEGFIFFSNYESAKGKELEENPNVSLLFFYEAMERQIRIKGSVVKLSEAENDAYFYSRPLASQLGAIVSPQSSKLNNGEDLEAILKSKIAQNEKPQRPKHWGGYLIKSNYFEFWQGRPSRLHNRIVYELKDSIWQKSLLAP